jgi:hypothetical protein
VRLPFSLLGQRLQLTGHPQEENPYLHSGGSSTVQAFVIVVVPDWRLALYIAPSSPASSYISLAAAPGESLGIGHPFGITQRRVPRDVNSKTFSFPAPVNRMGRAAYWCRCLPCDFISSLIFDTIIPSRQ